VEIYSTKRHKWEKRLRELVEQNNLPIDYGGSGESTTSVLERGETYTYSTTRGRKQSSITTEEEEPHYHHHPQHETATSIMPEKNKTVKHRCQALSVRYSSPTTTLLSLSKGQTMKLKVCTKSIVGGTFYITSPDGTSIFNPTTNHSGFVVRHDCAKIHQNGIYDEKDGEDEPTKTDFNITLTQQGVYKVKIVANKGSRFGSNTEMFLLVGQIYCDDNNGDKFDVVAANATTTAASPQVVTSVSRQVKGKERSHSSSPCGVIIEEQKYDAESHQDEINSREEIQEDEDDDLEDVALSVASPTSITPQEADNVPFSSTSYLNKNERWFGSTNNHRTATTFSTNMDFSSQFGGIKQQPTFELFANAKKEAFSTAYCEVPPHHQRYVMEEKEDKAPPSSSTDTAGMFSGATLFSSIFSSLICDGICGSIDSVE